MTDRLARRLVLETPEDLEDGGGGGARSWRAVGVHWAELRASRGSERVVAGAPASRVTHRARLRWAAEGAPARPEPAQRFREGGRTYEILAVGDDRPWRRFLICWLAEGTAQ